MTIPSIFQALAMEQMLTPKGTKIKKWQRVLIWVALFSVGAIVKGIANDYILTKNFTGVYGMVTFVVFLPVFYKDSLWKKMLAMITIVLGVSFSEIAFFPAVKIAGLENMGDWDYTKFKLMLITGLGAILSVIGIWIVLAIWKKIFREGKVSKISWIFCVYAIYQTVAFFFIPEFLIDGEMNLFVYISVIFSLLCTIALLFIAFSQSEKEKLESDLNEEMQKKKLEKIHFQEIEKRRAELDEIIQGNEQFLENTIGLMENHSLEDAEKAMMNQLQRLEKTREYPYCDIPIVNVILTEKARECERQKISLKIDVNLQREMSVSSFDLCRIISNMLDNAIRACGYLEQKEDEIVVIDFKAAVIREYLVIKCENPYNRNAGRFPEGTGQGIKILKDIAEKYHGYFQQDTDKERFKVQMNLKVTKDARSYGNESSSM